MAGAGGGRRKREIGKWSGAWQGDGRENVEVRGVRVGAWCEGEMNIRTGCICGAGGVVGRGCDWCSPGW